MIWSGYTQEFLTGEDKTFKVISSMSPETFALRIRSHCQRCTQDKIGFINQPCELCGRPVKTVCHWLFHLPLHCECCQSYMKGIERDEKFRRFVDPPCVNRADRGKLSSASPQSSPSRSHETRDPLLGGAGSAPKT